MKITRKKIRQLILEEIVLLHELDGSGDFTSINKTDRESIDSLENRVTNIEDAIRMMGGSIINYRQDIEDLEDANPQLSEISRRLNDTRAIKLSSRHIRMLVKDEISRALLEASSARPGQLGVGVATGDKSAALGAELTATTSNLNRQTQSDDPTNPATQQQRKVDDEEVGELDHEIEKDADVSG